MIQRFFSAADVFGKRRNLPAIESGIDASELRARLEARSRRALRRRSGYLLRIEVSAAVSILLIVLLFRSDFGPQTSRLDVMPSSPELVVLEDIQQTRQLVTPPPPPRPPAPVVVPDDEVLEEIDLDLDASIKFDEMAALPPPPPPVAARTEEEEAPDFFVVVEEMPELIGGLQSLNGVLQYPEVARQAGISGTVIVRIVVDKEGVPRSPEVLRSVNRVLDKAAVDAVLQLRFVPGRQRGRPVPVQIAFPVRFTLAA